MKSPIKHYICKSVVLTLMLIGLSVSLMGCNEKFVIPELATKYGYFCYPGTEWGMTPTEVFDSLQLNEHLFDTGVETDLIGGLSGIVYEGRATSMGDQSTNLSFRFTRFSEDAEPALSSITIANSYQRGDRRVDAVNEMVQQYKVPYTETHDDRVHDEVPEPFTLKFSSYRSASIDDQEQAIKDKWTALFPDGNGPSAESSLLSVLVYQYVENDKRYRIDYQATPAAYLAWCERNNK